MRSVGRSIAGPWLCLATLLFAIAPRAGAVPGSGAPGALPQQASPIEASEEDWRIARERAAWAIRELEPDSLAFGELVAAIGESFVGTEYVPGTLEVGPPERLVVELEGLDCVTLVETALTLSRLVRESPETVAEEAAFRRRYAEILTSIRYRGGELDGYPSRLHYFSEWIADNQARGRVSDLTRELGGRIDEERVDFMSTHADAYPALADDDALDAIRAIEGSLADRPRYFLPQEQVATAAKGIASGDIIAATSTVAGLDVAHTGIAVWRDGELRLLHAPLVGKDVQLSDTPLADRLLRIASQDGIMVARPLDPAAR